MLKTSPANSWIFAVLFLTLSLPMPVDAAGGSPAPPPSPQLTPQEEANQLYNDGLRMRDKAWKFEDKAEHADAAQREKMEAKMQKQFEKAIPKFQRATRLNPGLYQAHSSLGYALRRTGRYEEALAAYNRSLALNPYYTEAVEYRAEAYLGLGRLDEAKTAYMFLFNRDQKRAEELLEAMATWVVDHRENPKSVTAEAVETFAAWVAERSELAATTQQASTGGAW